jgi:hypothetical protein
MRDFSCFGDRVVAVLAAGATGAGGAGAALDRSLETATTSVYGIALSSHKELRIRVTSASTSTSAGSGASVAGLVEVEAEVPGGADGGCSGLHPPLLGRLAVATSGGHWGSVGGFAVDVVARAWTPWTARARG